MAETNLIAKKTGSTYIASIIFLVIVIVSTIALHFYNNSLINDITKVKTNIISINSNITEVEKDKLLQIYSLLELNKKAIDSYSNMNKVNNYINHMKVISGKYNLDFIGFNLIDGNLSTNVEVISNDKGIAYYKTREFIQKYRKDTNALFDLDFVTSVEGMDEIKFKVNFKIK